MAPPFAYDVAVMRITVAALMTTPWIARFLEVPPDTDLVLIPGLCEGDPAAIAAKARTRVEKGPKDLREVRDDCDRRDTGPPSGGRGSSGGETRCREHPAWAWQAAGGGGG